MRGPTPYEKYILRLKDYYKIKGMERPSWIDAASEYYGMLFYSGRDLNQQCSNTNIPKATMEWLSKLDQTLVSEDLPAELREGARDCIMVLSEMYHTLTEGSDEYFINQWTLSRAGRKKMREYLNALPSVSNIKPPNTEFNNVPLYLIFSNRINWVDAEYELTITAGGSRICLKNGDPDSRYTVYIDFTESFLDKIIPLLQWESLVPYLQKRNPDDIRDDSAYQDFTTVLIDVNRYYYELKLQGVDENNPYIKILRLVWDEYESDLRENNLVLPWFKVLGWTSRVGI